MQPKKLGTECQVNNLDEPFSYQGGESLCQMWKWSSWGRGSLRGGGLVRGEPVEFRVSQVNNGHSPEFLN